MFSHSITKAVAATSLHRERNTTAATALCCWKTGLTYLSSDDNILPSLIIERKSVSLQKIILQNHFQQPR
jgi:hypothetical protein